MSKSLKRRQVIIGAASLAGGAALVAGPAEARSERDIKKWDHVVDVVVIGLGVAGGSAAYEAAKAGAKVVVLDRGSAAINESHGNDIYLGGGTPTQKAYGVE
ncbi:MAG: FAD-dependent oxidoreductase, partial [Pseudomonadales bacterium]|nr:FAD-dependent oxidoreductase [Pseudomonadales bacterium]